MREGIHPKYKEIEAHCACGNTFKTRSTKAELRLEICSACHPFFTGRQKLVDTEGRVERFTKKYGVQTVEQRVKDAKTAEAKAKKLAPKTKRVKRKGLSTKSTTAKKTTSPAEKKTTSTTAKKTTKSKKTSPKTSKTS